MSDSRRQCRNEVFALDSTAISLSIRLFTWAQGKYSQGALKIHTLLDLRGSIPNFIFITDGKCHDSNALDVIMPISDAIYLMVEFYDDEKDVLLAFLTNNFEVSALEIARLYKNRWQIEVFFNLKYLKYLEWNNAIASHFYNEANSGDERDVFIPEHK